jgi:hypothetical protein
MLGNHISIPFHLHGTLAANATMRWQAPYTCHLRGVQAVGSNTNDATLKVGTPADDDKFFTAFAIGDTGVPVVKTIANFASTALNGQLAEGDILLFTLDFDGNSGTAAANVSIIADLTEG